MTEAEIQLLRKRGLLHGDAMQCGHCQKLMDTIDEIVKQAVVEAALVFLPKF